LICPKCGEDNAENFRFCGMCGTVLEARPEIRRPAGAPVPNLPKMTSAAEPARSATVETANDLPSPDSLRQNSFSGLDSFFEPEEPKSGRGRLFLLLVLLAAFGAAGWWTYTNYLASSYTQKPRPRSRRLPLDRPLPRQRRPQLHRRQRQLPQFLQRTRMLALPFPSRARTLQQHLLRKQLRSFHDQPPRRRNAHRSLLQPRRLKQSSPPRLTTATPNFAEAKVISTDAAHTRTVTRP